MKLESGNIRLILVGITVLLLGLGAFFVFRVILGLPAVPEGADAAPIYSNDPDTMNGVGTSIYYAITLIGVVLALIVTGIVMTSMSEPKRLVRPLIFGAGVAILALVIYYGFAGNEVLPEWVEVTVDEKTGEGALTPGESQFIGAGIILTISLVVVAALSILAAWVRKLII